VKIVTGVFVPADGGESVGRGGAVLLEIDLSAAQGFPQRLGGTAVDDDRQAWSWAARSFRLTDGGQSESSGYQASTVSSDPVDRIPAT